MKLQDLSVAGGFMALFKGETGSGKTSAAGSFPGPVLFIDADQRWKPLTTCAWTKDRKDIEVESFKDSDFERLWSLAKKEALNPRFTTYVIDSITSVASMMVNYSGSFRAGSKADVGVIRGMEIQDYGAESRGIVGLLELFKHLNLAHKKNVIFSAHVIDVEHRPLNESPYVTRSILSYGKKPGAMLPTQFDEVYHFDQQPNIDTNARPKRFIWTQNAGIDSAKSALDLPVKIDITGKPLWPIIEAHMKSRGWTK